MSHWDRLADQLLSVAERRAAAVSGRVRRFAVLTTGPLTAQEAGGDLVISEEDEDVEVYKPVADAALAPGDVLLVREHEGTYEVTAVIDA